MTYIVGTAAGLGAMPAGTTLKIGAATWTLNTSNQVVLGGTAQQPAPAFVRPALASWLTAIQGGAGATDNAGGPLVLRLPSQAGVFQLKGLVVAAPAAPYTATALLSCNGGHRGQRLFGMVLRDAAAGALTGFGVYCNTDNGGQIYDGINVDRWANPTTNNGFIAGRPTAWSPGSVWLRVVNDGTNLVYLAATSGHDWTQVASETVAATGQTPTQVGFYGSNTDAVGVDGTAADGLEMTVSLWDWTVASGAAPLAVAPRARF